MLKEDRKENQGLLDLIEVPEDLEKKSKLADIQICPECRSPNVRRVGTMSRDLWGHMEILPRKIECEECGWRIRLVLKATDRSLSIKEVSVIAEATKSK